LLDHIEEGYQHNLAICYRCGHTIEPIPSKQWFIDVNKEFSFKQSKEHPLKGIKDKQKVTLKKLMQQVIKSGQIKIIPDRFDKTYFHWIDNLRDWCISRQIWVGHQIPVWYKKDNEEEIYVDINPPKDLENWQQDPDTLDTWFSSGLWTFSPLGWPENTKDLKTFHPTTVMETMFDILFFWVARMIMMSTYALGEIPFETVYLHARVLDKDGAKMSKSKPETMIDPLDVCQKYGTDAVRLSLLMGVAPGADVRLSENKIAGFRNFANKLWNISRFILLNIDEPKFDSKQPKPKTLADKWILSRLDQAIQKTTADIEAFNFSYASERLKDFTWNELADWYLEIAKIEGDKSAILNYILNTVLKLWHPFMPFVTEAIWEQVYGKKAMLMVETWPVVKTSSAKIGVEFALIKNIVTNIRSLRSDYKIEPAKRLRGIISAGKKQAILEENAEIIKTLARLEELEISKKAAKPETAVGFVETGVEVYIDLAGTVDFAKEKKRLQKEIADLKDYLTSLEKKLGNKKFVESAPEEVVVKERDKLANSKEKLDKLKQQLNSLV